MTLPDLSEERLLASIEPKSDQLSYDDFLNGPRTFTVAGVSAGSAESPVQIRLEGEARFYRPGKSMRRVLVMAWSSDGHSWLGRSMTLYGDPSVKFGGVMVGGIRISHMTDIDGPQTFNLTMTRGKKAPFKVLPLSNGPIAPEKGAAGKPSADKGSETVLAAADFDNSNLTEAQRGLVKVAKCGINGLQDVWQAYEPEEKKTIGGKAFLAFVKNIAVRSDLGDTFDEAGNPLDPALGI